jgi:hypothetical protein
MKILKLTDEAPKWFIWKIKFTHKETKFGEVKIKAPLQHPISLYVFLFKIMEDSFKDNPELKMWKFWEIFEASMIVNWKEVTEKQIMDLFGEMFTIKFSKK